MSIPDFRIIQLTDLHIGDPDEYPLGVHLRNNLHQILAEVERMNPNLLIITGDFCFQGPKPEIYQWIREQIEKTGIPFEIIAGNHDDKAMMTTYLTGEDLSNAEDEYYFSDTIQNFHLLYLDSGTGLLSGHQLNWIQEELTHVREKQLIIFMHHPPLLAGVPHMDTGYALQNREDLIDILKDHHGSVQIFCGHYHVHRTISTANINVHITPSLYMQIFPYSQDFAIDHYQTGYRIIDFAGDELRHEVRYLPGNRF